MKYILLALLISWGSLNAQKLPKSTTAELPRDTSNLKFRTYFSPGTTITFGKPDTIRCILTYVDTSIRIVPGLRIYSWGTDGEVASLAPDIKIKDRNIYWAFGYFVWALGEANEFLDENKKPLKKGYVVISTTFTL